MSGMSGMDFFTGLLGSPTSVEPSADGKAIVASGEIASGVPMSISIRPSTSSGTAVDANVDGTRVRHVEGDPSVE